ncbi:hypothetical protein BsWGS_20019 [Bradybaena similaris]
MGGTTSTQQPASTTGGATATRNDLVRMYGYFTCPKCRQQWESANVYCQKGTDKAAYGQECKKCRVTCMPYRVEKILCLGCGERNCICKQKQERHIDPNKHHRSDLCAKCKAGLPCNRGF